MSSTGQILKRSEILLSIIQGFLFHLFCKLNTKFKFCSTLTFQRRLEIDINNAVRLLTAVKKSHLSR